MMLARTPFYRPRKISSTLLYILVNDNFSVTGESRNFHQIYLNKLIAQTSNNTFEYHQEVGYPLQSFSTSAETILIQASDPGKLCEELEIAIDEHRFNDAWTLKEQHMQIEGFPRKSLVNKLLANLAETQDFHWLEKACALVEQAFEEHKHLLLEKDTLIYLSLCLAKCGLAIQASTILRKLLEMEKFPPVTAWSAILAYMSQTSPGAYLATELVLEMGYLFQDGRVDPRKKINEPLISMKPNATTFNIALCGCLLFGTTRKAEQLLDMMPRIGVKADINLLIVMANIYERNGRKEELKKLKRHVDELHNLSDIQFLQFYSSLLSCELNFGDLESASSMVLEMLRKGKKAQNSLGASTLSFEASKSIKSRVLPYEETWSDRKLLRSPSLSLEEFLGDRKFLKLEAQAKELLDMMLAKLQRQVDLITAQHGILQPTDTIYVKLVKGFLESGKMKELAEFLIKAEKEDSPVSSDNSVLVHVIKSCILLGWLGQAHDLLDEMRWSGVKISSSVYSALLKACCKENQLDEVHSLLSDVKKAGIQLDASCYEVLFQSRVLQEDMAGALNIFKEMKDARISRSGHQEFDMLVKGCEDSGQAGLMSKLLKEIKEGQRVDCGVHDWNSVIHFFCKKRLMQDAEKALNKMRILGHNPNAQTFHSMVTGYAAIGGKYIEVTELWGEMKALAFSSSGMKFDQELLDSVLYTFVRGGFFVRANEVVEMMVKGKMFVDKYKYRMLFLKYHKTMYKGKTPKFQTESQLKKREAALTFKKWVGLH